MPRYKIINNIKTQCSAEEETKLDALNVEWTKNRNARITAETAAANKKASGKQKLKDLGLDDDEIKALIGA
tara:strand:+ start:612 stop:824 length:213 start_codon:yes stop_codon:yes gene_type:complete